MAKQEPQEHVELRSRYWDAYSGSNRATAKVCLGLAALYGSEAMPHQPTVLNIISSGVLAVGVYCSGTGVWDKLVAMRDEFRAGNQMKREEIPFLPEQEDA